MTPADTTALTLTRHLPVKLDQYRKQALVDIVIAEGLEEERLTAHLRNVNKSVKLLIEGTQKKQNDARHAVNNGFEMAPVACEQRPDIEKNKMVTYRLDSGEQVDERALTKEEMVEVRKGKKP
jgi:hypothetical protein